jgi:trehalose 2-sulfotransferase
MKSYIISATGRSGSSLLCEALYNTGVAGKPWEALRDIRDYSVETVRTLIQDCSTPNGVFGSKAMWPQWERFVIGIGRATGQAPQAALGELLPGLAYVSITRGDKLRQAISLSKAELTNYWTCKEDPAAAPRAVYSRKDVELQLKRIQEEEEAWDAYFSAYGIEPLRVTYEGLEADYAGTALGILDFLDIPRPAKVCWYRQLKKQRNDETEDWREMFLKGL